MTATHSTPAANQIAQAKEIAAGQAPPVGPTVTPPPPQPQPPQQRPQDTATISAAAKAAAVSGKTL